MKKDTYAILGAIWLVGSILATHLPVSIACFVLGLYWTVLHFLTKE